MRPVLISGKMVVANEPQSQLTFFPGAPAAICATVFFRTDSVLFRLFGKPAKSGEGRNTALTLTALQEDDVDLEVGALFQQAGTVKIVRLNVPHLRGSSGTGAVGAVTVVVS